MNPNEHIKTLKDFIFKDLQENHGFTSADKDLDLLIFQAPTTLRLRRAGFYILRRIYDHEDFKLEERLSGKDLLTLKKHIAWPYWLPATHSHISIFSVKDSFFLKLQGGDVKKWLGQIRNRKDD